MLINREVDAFFRDHLTREGFRWHVGRAMFCPVCEGVLDVSRSVELDALRGYEGQTSFPAIAGSEAEPLCIMVCEGACTDAARHGLTQTGFRVLATIVGRELFPPARPSKRARRIHDWLARAEPCKRVGCCNSTTHASGRCRKHRRHHG